MIPDASDQDELGQIEEDMAERHGNPAVEHVRRTMQNPEPNDLYHGSDLTIRGDTVGIRVAVNNFSSRGSCMQTP